MAHEIFSDLKGKVAIITGSSSGIGQGAAECLASHGCSVVITGRKSEGLAETKQKCLAAGLTEEQVLIVPGNVTDVEYLEALVSKTIDRFGKLNILVNNAGAGSFKQLNGCPIEVFDEVMNLNCRAVIQLTDLCMPHLVESKGSVIIISSIAGKKVVKYTHFYGVSKAALSHYAKSLALEVAPKGVRVNVISPGLVLTKVLTNPQHQAGMDAFVKKIPLQIAGAPADIARLIIFLASDASRYITGSDYNIDGGSMLGMLDG